MENLLKQDSTLTLEGPLQEEAQPVHKDDYASSLRAHGITDYTESEYYYHVGEPKVAQGWLLHITVIPAQMEQLLDGILPVLMEYGVAFKLAKNESVHKHLNNGKHGNYKIGKVITILLDNDVIITPLVRQLIDLTADKFTGPVVTTDFYISTILFTRYGSYLSRVETDTWGNRLRLIQDGVSNWFQDQYYTPPIIPQGIHNPFLELVKPQPAPPKVHLIGNKYMLVAVLKSDNKGNVWKALYFTKWLIPKWCVVKEGKKGMFPDALGRDTRDKLAWQYRLHSDLPASPWLPKAIDYIDVAETGHVYFVMEYVKKGVVLSAALIRQFNRNAWFALPKQVQQLALGYLIDIIKSIQYLQQYGYLHRDITANNFLIDKQNKVHLIDLELAWSFKDGLPDPPFTIGTPGYMSPEQAGLEIPTLPDDNYSVGALLINLFTGGFEPFTVVEYNRKLLANKLFFWIGSSEMVQLIMNCLDTPAQRPTIDVIFEGVSKYTAFIDNTTVPHNVTPPLLYDVAAIRVTIEKAISCLTEDLLTHDQSWLSYIDNQYGRDVYPLGDRHVYGQIYKGAGGILYTLGRLAMSGFNIDSCRDNIQAGLAILQTEMLERLDGLNASLYFGKAGLALTLVTCIEQQWIEDTPYYQNIIRNCFLTPSTGTNILYGLAGQGLGALQCVGYIEEDTLRDLLTQYVTILLQAQQKDGSWLQVTHPKPEKQTSFGYGIAGIIYFLLVYHEQYYDVQALASAKKGLHYLQKAVKYKNGHYEWQNSDQNKNIGYWWCTGSPGIAQAYLKAYELTKESLYLDIAEKALLLHPKYLVCPLLSQCHGIAGLGEVYIEAYRITQNKEWWERAEWVASLLVNLGRPTPQRGIYWQADSATHTTADFMVGNTGIIHFLLRFLHPNKFGFPVIGS